MSLLIGSKLKQYRELHGLTQSKIAHELNLDSKYYGQIERDERPMSLCDLIHLCQFYEINLDSLIHISIDNHCSQLKEDHINNIIEMLNNRSLTEIAVLERQIEGMILLFDKPSPTAPL